MTNNQRLIEKEVNATATRRQDEALASIPQGWERVTDGDSQKGDMSWVEWLGASGRFANCTGSSIGISAKYFICLIREVAK